MLYIPLKRKICAMTHLGSLESAAGGLGAAGCRVRVEPRGEEVLEYPLSDLSAVMVVGPCQTLPFTLTHTLDTSVGGNLTHEHRQTAFTGILVNIQACIV